MSRITDSEHATRAIDAPFGPVMLSAIAITMILGLLGTVLPLIADRSDEAESVGYVVSVVEIAETLDDGAGGSLTPSVLIAAPSTTSTLDAG